jgi:hypothetical protein
MESGTWGLALKLNSFYHQKDYGIMKYLEWELSFQPTNILKTGHCSVCDLSNVWSLLECCSVVSGHHFRRVVCPLLIAFLSIPGFTDPAFPPLTSNSISNNYRQ